MLGGLDILVPGTVTEVVFIFLCSKPVFVLSALLAGILARRRLQSEPTAQLPEQV